MAASAYLVTAPHPICLPPDGRQAVPGEQVLLSDRTVTDLIALGQLTALQTAPKNAPLSNRDVAAEPAPDKE